MIGYWSWMSEIFECIKNRDENSFVQELAWVNLTRQTFNFWLEQWFWHRKCSRHEFWLWLTTTWNCRHNVCLAVVVNVMWFHPAAQSASDIDINAICCVLVQEKIVRMFYVWAFCRDQSVLDPRAAWRLIDLSASPAEQWLWDLMRQNSCLTCFIISLSSPELQGCS